MFAYSPFASDRRTKPDADDIGGAACAAEIPPGPLMAKKTLSEHQIHLIAKALADPRRHEILQQIGASNDTASCSDIRELPACHRRHPVPPYEGTGNGGPDQNHSRRQICPPGTAARRPEGLPDPFEENLTEKVATFPGSVSSIRQLSNCRSKADSTGRRMMSKLKNKVAVVTGASKGIGAAIAKALAAEGASVVVNYASSKEGADRVVADITAKGGKAVAVQGDVSKAKDVDRIFAETKKQFGSLDVLVNNAGIYEFSPIGEVTEDKFHRLFNTNVLGLLLASQQAANLFGPEGGSIINIGSVVSRITPPGSSIYSATKSAVDAVTGALARELGPKKIRVNSINPGMVETEGVHSAGFIGSDFEKGAVAQTPLGRIAQPGDIAPLAVFLASSDSGWLTGETILASGGLR